jgi:NADH-quinone oxidoreductase subunit G
MPKLTIDSRETNVPDGTNLIEAARTLGVEIPHFCYHPGLSVAGNCRMCLVEIEKVPRLQVACNTTATEGMVVRTDSEKVRKARAGVMEFLLLNHPIDCPICDCAGECRLQDYYMEHDGKASRLEEPKNRKAKAQPIGPHVMLDKERCILCSRCVRFTDEVTRTHELGIFGRGSVEEIGLAPGTSLDNAYSGCVVDLCPVGALTDRDFRFVSRPWFLKSTDTVCAGCATGCSIVLDTNTKPYNRIGSDRAVRITPRLNPAVNGHWMCDRGRYSHKEVDRGRLRRAKAHGAEVSPEQGFASLVREIRDAMRAAPGRAAFLLSPGLSNESLWALRRLARLLGAGAPSGGVDLGPRGEGDDLLMSAELSPNVRGAADLGLGKPGRDLLEAAARGAYDCLVVVGAPVEEPLARELAGKLRVFAGFYAVETPALEHYPWLFPLSLWAEEDGTFTNAKGRVQRLRKALEPLAGARPAWAWARAWAQELGLEPGPGSAEALFAAMAAETVGYAGLDYAALGDLGASTGAAGR